MISLNSVGQDFENLDEVKLTNIKDCQEYKTEILKSSDYILSIPLDFDKSNREIINSFLMKWTEIGLEKGYQINDNIAKTIKIKPNLMSVYLACIVKSVPDDFNKAIDFRDIKDKVIKNYTDYCDNFDLDDKEIIKTIQKLKNDTNPKSQNKKTGKAPNNADDEGLKQGLWKEYFPGEKFEYALINYVNDTKDGEFLAYRKDNSLYMKGNYKDGKLHGTHIIYYPNGQIKIKRNFIEGHQSGTKYTYNEDGSIYSIVNFKDDKLHGSYFKYDAKGELKWHVEYRNGEKVKVIKMK